MSGFWLVAKAKTRREAWGAENAARQGYVPYLPLLPPEIKKAKKPALPACLFPGYLFVWTEGRWHSLLGTYGITGLVMQGASPAILPEKAIEELKAREGSDGYIKLPSASEGRFKAGDAVRVCEGLFSGYSGLVAGVPDEKRVRILLEYLGRKTSVEINEAALVLAN